MGGTTKIRLQILSFTEESILFYGKSEYNYFTRNCLNLVIMLGTILIDSDLLV